MLLTFILPFLGMYALRVSFRRVSMTLQFDHIIYFTEHPNRMKQKWEAQEFHGVNGGTHEVWGTYNTLIHFGLKYIELLGIKDLTTFKKYNEENVDYTLMSSIYKEHYREGFHSVALRTREIETIAESLKNKGFLVDGPTTFSRVKEDGTVVEWRLLFIKYKENNVPLPFIIDWGMPDDVRLEGLDKADLLFDNGEITEVNIATPNVEKTLDIWQNAFDLEKIDKNILRLGDMKITFNDEIVANQIIIHKNNEVFIF